MCPQLGCRVLNPFPEHHVCHQPLISGVVFSAQDCATGNTVESTEILFDLSKLVSVPSHLHLMVDATEELELAVVSKSGQIARAIQA